MSGYLPSPRTPEFKRSTRVLVQTNTPSPVNHQPFVPRRRSFGILIKPYDPLRSPARARKSRSRERLNSLNSSKNNSRSSSVSSMLGLTRRKSQSLGNIDLDDEFLELDAQLHREEQQRKKRQSQPVRNLSSSPRRRSLSRGSSIHSRSESMDVLNVHDTPRSPVQRQRSNEISECSTASILTDSSNKRGRSSKSDRSEVTSDNNTKGMKVGNDKRMKTTDIDSRSRAAQYDVAQQRKLSDSRNTQGKETSFNHHNVNIEVHNATVPAANNQRTHLQNIDTIQHHDMGRIQEAMQQSIPSYSANAKRAPTNRLQNLLADSSSDEGTDLDDQPWSRPHVSLELNMNKPHQTNQHLDRSYLNTTDSSQFYSNIDELKPMLPPKCPPKLPPKTYPQQREPTNQPINPSNGFVSNKENYYLNQRPPVPPPKMFPNRLREQMHGATTRNQHEQLVHSLNSNVNMQDGICDMPSSVQAQQMNNRRPSTGWQTKNSGNNNFQNNWPNQYRHDIANPNSPGMQRTVNFEQQPNWQTDQMTRGNPQPDRLTNHLQGMNNEAPIRSHKMGGITSMNQWENHIPHERGSLRQSQRQFKSTANFRNAGLIHDNIENSGRQSSRKMQRAKSTEVLSVGGFIRGDPEFDNEDAASNLKKVKSTIVLDDISVTGSFEEEAKLNDNKQRLSHEPKRGKLEMWSGVLHLLAICSGLITTVTLALMTNNWDRYAHKCPLFVESNLQHDRFWGNPSMVPCYIAAYLPLVPITISFILVFVHGGLLFFWRSNRKSSSYYMTRSFGITLLFFNFIAFGVSLAIACIVTDGLRQTCLSFKLISDIDYRPTSCQNGFTGLDLNYNIEGTFYYLIFGVIGSWLHVIFTVINFIMYTIRAEFCRCM